jgi:hypothetical protein
MCRISKSPQPIIILSRNNTRKKYDSSKNKHNNFRNRISQLQDFSSLKVDTIRISPNDNEVCSILVNDELIISHFCSESDAVI